MNGDQITRIAVCICTRRRNEQLGDLLASLGRMQIPGNVQVEIVVVENDAESLAEQIVREFARNSRLMVHYFLEKRRGIATCRNRSIKEAGNVDFYCFVDDDQIVDSTWLVELVKCQREFKSDGVWGRNPPLFGHQVAPYIVKFHTPRNYNYGHKSHTGYTNCLMLARSIVKELPGPFDERLNFTGAEDSFLLDQLIKKGADIRFNPNAIAHEVVPEHRTSLAYIIKRTFRDSNSSFLVESLIDPEFSRWLAIFHLCARLFFGFIIMIPHLLLSQAERLKGVIKVVDALGGLTYLLGFRTRFYQSAYNG